MGVVSTRLLKPAISGRPFAMAAFTDGRVRDAAWLSLLSQTSVIHNDTPQIRGMAFKVRHLVSVEEVK